MATTTTGGVVDTTEGPTDTTGGSSSDGGTSSGSEGSSGSGSTSDSSSGSEDDTGSSSESGSSSSTGDPLVPGPCGDGVLNLGEACDDGNEEDGDGCSADCSAATCLVPVTHDSVQDGVDDGGCATLWILPGTYVENVDVARDVTLVGMDFEPVIIDGGNAGSVFTTTDVHAVFRNLEITGGLAERGAGINADDGRVELDNCRIYGNTAEVEADIAWSYGGGVAGDMTWFDVYGGTEITNNLSTASSDDGGAYALGGGMYLQNGRAYISGSAVIDGNRAESSNAGTSANAQGGGIYANSAIVEITESTISSNTASASAANAVYSYGGGVYHSSAGFTITDSVVDGNVSEVTGMTASAAGAFGGGLYLYGYDPVVDGCTISQNRAHEDNGNAAEGGGIAFRTTQSQVLTIVDTTLIDNEADATTGQGGGLHADANGQIQPAVHFIRSLATENTATSEGGFAYLTGGPNFDMELTNSTVTGNTAASAGALYFEGVSAELFVSSSTLTSNTSGITMVDDITGVIRNSILWGNAAADCSFLDTAALTSAGYNIVDCTLGGDLTGNLDVDPELGALADHGGPTHTHDLAATSPARNAGDPTGCVDATLTDLATDQRGEDRHTEDQCDIGAFEYVP